MTWGVVSMRSLIPVSREFGFSSIRVWTGDSGPKHEIVPTPLRNKLLDPNKRSDPILDGSMGRQNLDL